jgi:tripartite-type tricarboxylate transporter receptor subunit TctC
MVESGFAGFAASAWFGVFAPAKVPTEQMERIFDAVSKAVGTPEFQKHLATMGLTPRQMSRAEFTSFVAADSERWRLVIEKSKVSIQD